MWCSWGHWNLWVNNADRLAACLSASPSSAADPKDDDGTRSSSHAVEAKGPMAANGVVVMGDLDSVLRTCPNCTQSQRANAELVMKVASLESRAWCVRSTRLPRPPSAQAKMSTAHALPSIWIGGKAPRRTHL